MPEIPGMGSGDWKCRVTKKDGNENIDRVVNNARWRIYKIMPKISG
jgi:hypothetical protein